MNPVCCMTKTGNANVQQDNFSNGHYLVEWKASTGGAYQSFVFIEGPVSWYEHAIHSLLYDSKLQHTCAS